MKYLRNALDLYINSSIHVSLAVVAFTILSFMEYGLAVDLNLIGFIFFASITGYNFVKYAGIAKLHHLSLARNLRLIQIFSLASFIALIYFSLKLSVKELVASAILGGFTVFYALPIFSENRNLRSITGLKILIIAFVWAGTSVVLPQIESKIINIWVLGVDFFQRFFLVILLTLPFEIRDLNYDEENLGTIPQRLGVHRTKILGSILAAIILVTEYFQKGIAFSFAALFIILGISLILLWNSTRNQSKYYSSFWVEGIPLVYVGIYWLLKHSV